MDQDRVFQISVSRRTKHDLRTPLNQVIGYSELLEEELGDIDRPDLTADLKKIQGAAHSLLRALDEVFDFERPQQIDPEPSPAPEPADGDEAPHDDGGEGPPAGEGTAPAASGPGPRREPASFLVVDDNDKNREILARRLAQLGHAVTTAADGFEALERLGERDFDIVLLDVIMPGMSGLEVLVKIRETHSPSQLPVIMATARDHAGDIVEALQLGANDYVTKPLNFPVLIARAETHLSIRRLSRIKEDFMQMVSHDLKTPLMGIMGAATLIEARLPEAAELTGLISRGAGVIQNIVTHFLDMRSLEDGQVALDLTPLNLNGIVLRAVAANAGYAAAKEIILAADPVADPPEIHADPMRIEQVLLNLIGNALKFGGAGDEVVARTRRDGEHLLVEVIDSGPGLLEEDMPLLFTKYARLSNKPTGGEKSSGLGLAICREIISLHGGRIGARNNTGGGVTFWFRLPLTRPGV